MASMYAVFHGPKRLKKISKRIHNHTQILCKQLLKLGYKQLNENFFDTILIDIGDSSINDIKLYAEDAKMNFNFINENLISISLDEKDDIQNVYDIILVFSKAKNQTLDKNDIENILNLKHYEKPESIDKVFLRTSNFLEFDVFRKLPH